MKRSRRVSYPIIAVLLIAIGIGCAGTRKNDPALALRVQRVQAALREIASALEAYQADRGYFPKGMATLRDAGYLSIMPDVEREWEFQQYTDGGRIMMIEAISRASMPDGAGYKIIYRVPEQTFEGYGISEFPR